MDSHVSDKCQVKNENNNEKRKKVEKSTTQENHD